MVRPKISKRGAFAISNWCNFFRRLGAAMAKLIVSFVLALGLAAADAEAQTLSGRPEATFQGRSAVEIRARLVNEMVNNGFSVSQDTPNVLAFNRPITDFAAQLLY